MGDSDKLDDPGPGSYRFVEHREYLDGFLNAVGLGSNAVFVIHDWGSALGFDWGNRHRDRTRGFCYMEALVRPVTWEEWPEAAKAVFQGFRSPAGENDGAGEECVRRACAPRLDPAEGLRGGNGGLPPTVRDTG